MLIEIESVYGNKLLHGEKNEFSEINLQLQNLLASVNEKDFVPVFCAALNFEELPYDEEQQVDYVIDLDTHKMYKPKY